MKNLLLTFALLGLLACNTKQTEEITYNTQYPLISYEELEDTKPVDEEAWDNLSESFNLTWADKDIHYSYKNVPNVASCTDTTIKVWRGERVNALALIYTTEEIKDVELKISQIDGVKGSAEANFVTYVMTDGFNADGNGTCGYRPDHSIYDSSMVADVIDNQKIKDLKPRRVRPVWCTFEVPMNIEPGNYDVTLKVKEGWKTLGKLNAEINVLDKTLPAPKDYVFHLDLWQQPYSVSRYYNVEKWSKEHFEAMRPMMKALARAGQKVISTEIIYEPWGEQSHDKFDPMIETTLKTDSTWAYDYTIFDRWVEFMMECGIDKEIKCFSMVPWDMNFRYLDEATGEYKFLHAKTSDAEYREFWTPLLQSLAQHLKEKGWYEKTSICMDERELSAMLDAYNLLQEVVPGMKMSLAGNYHAELVDLLYDFTVQYEQYFTKEELERRKANGLVTLYYTSCATTYPNSYTFSSPAESTCMPLHAVQAGFDGFLRWAYNNWGEDPLRDTRYRMWGAGDSFLIYPGFRSSVRFERFVEGVQDAEKIRILREEYKANGNSEALAELEKKINSFAEGEMNAQNAGCKVKALEAILNK